MNYHHPHPQDVLKISISFVGMVNPNRCIDKDHVAFDLRRREAAGLRRGGTLNPGIVPPKAISLCAASRSTKALKASFTSPLFSSIPV
jgi:hypothetical protein